MSGANEGDILLVFLPQVLAATPGQMLCCTPVIATCIISSTITCVYQYVTAKYLCLYTASHVFSRVLTGGIITTKAISFVAQCHTPTDMCR
jgi:hypothetical protein